MPHVFVDGDGDPLRELDEATLEAINAVGWQVAKKHTCMITKETERPEPIGSGTFVQVGDRLFVATARHLFRDFKTDDVIGMYWGEEDNRTGIIRSDAILDGELDLAAIPLPSDTRACGVLLRGQRATHQEDEQEVFVISGVPAEKCTVDLQSRQIVVGHYSCGLVALPRKRWPTSSEVPISPDVDLFLNYTRDFAADDHGNRTRQIAPYGLSGGGIWSVPARADGIWSPTDARLVAIQSSVEADRWRYLRATRIERWVRLVADNRSGTSA
jgi:hypothetical protein